MKIVNSSGIPCAKRKYNAKLLKLDFLFLHIFIILVAVGYIGLQLSPDNLHCRQ